MCQTFHVTNDVSIRYMYTPRKKAEPNMSIRLIRYYIHPTLLPALQERATQRRWNQSRKDGDNGDEGVVASKGGRREGGGGGGGKV